MPAVAGQAGAEKAEGNVVVRWCLFWRTRTLPQILDSLTARAGDSAQRRGHAAEVQCAVGQVSEALDRRTLVW